MTFMLLLKILLGIILFPILTLVVTVLVLGFFYFSGWGIGYVAGVIRDGEIS